MAQDRRAARPSINADTVARVGYPGRMHGVSPQYQPWAHLLRAFAESGPQARGGSEERRLRPRAKSLAVHMRLGLTGSAGFSRKMLGSWLKASSVTAHRFSRQ